MEREYWNRHCGFAPVFSYAILLCVLFVLSAFPAFKNLLSILALSDISCVSVEGRSTQLGLIYSPQELLARVLERIVLFFLGVTHKCRLWS